MGHHEATKRAPISPRGGPKSRSIGPANELRALKEPLATLKKLPSRFLGAKMELKEVQKSSTDALRSSKDDLKIQQHKYSPNHEKKH